MFFNNTLFTYFKCRELTSLTDFNSELLKSKSLGYFNLKDTFAMCLHWGKTYCFSNALLFNFNCEIGKNYWKLYYLNAICRGLLQSAKVQDRAKIDRYLMLLDINLQRNAIENPLLCKSFGTTTEINDLFSLFVWFDWVRFCFCVVVVVFFVSNEKKVNQKFSIKGESCFSC